MDEDKYLMSGCIPLLSRFKYISIFFFPQTCLLSQSINHSLTVLSPSRWAFPSPHLAPDLFYFTPSPPHALSLAAAQVIPSVSAPPFHSQLLFSLCLILVPTFPTLPHQGFADLSCFSLFALLHLQQPSIQKPLLIGRGSLTPKDIQTFP